MLATKPKITLILNKNDKKVYVYPSLRKTQNFLRNKARVYLKMDYFITFRVVYKDGLQNSGTYNTLVDLNWAYQAFVKEYLR